MNKYFRIVFLQISILFFLPEIKSQNTYNILIDHENQSEWGYSLLMDMDTIVMTGYTNVLKDGFYRDGVFFRKLDLEGNIFRENLIADTCVLYTVGYPGNLVKIDNQYLTSGIYQYCDYNFEGGVGSFGMVYKFNEIGDTIWTKKFDSQSYSIIYKGATTTNNSYLSAGVSVDTATLIDKFYIIKIDSTGEIVWENTFGYLLNNYAFSIDSYTNGDFIIGGLTDPTTSFSQTDGYLAKLDSSGNLIWQKKIGTPDDDNGCIARITFDQQNIYLQQSLDTVVSIGDAPMPDYVGKLDYNGNFIWRTFFNGPYKQDIWGIREMEKKSIMVVGTKIPDDVSQGSGFICKLDSNGVKLWERTYYTRTDRDNYFTDVAKVSDGGYILTGSAWSATDRDVWLVRLDSMGCLEPGCDIVDVPTITVNNTTLFNFYPNPMHNTATVELQIPYNFQILSGATIMLQIMDVSCKIVDTYANIPISNPGETIRFDVYRKNLAAGYYHALVKYNNVNFGSYKFVIN
ncbi:MAG TPA: hypothetical protein PLB46_01225 [Chitinophagales bacterium]|nr:hypothetical protein [Chitinophagales bacterium]